MSAYTDINGYTSETFGNPHAAARAARRAEIEALRQRANVASFAARRAWFSQRSREMGGYTARTRDQIDAECEAKAREAKQAVYFAAGYHHCQSPNCDRLASPQYRDCPTCHDLKEIGLTK